MLDVVIAGVSSRGLAWAQAVAAHRGFRLAGIADIDAAVLAARADELGVPPEGRHRDVVEALRSGRYQVAIVVVPNHLHYPVAKAVLEAGVACLLEKPFAEEMSHAEELVRIAEERRLPLVITHNYRYKPLYVAAAAALRDGGLGRLSAVHASFHRHRPPRREHERPMRYPMLFLQGIHHLDWMLSLLSSPIETLRVEHRLPDWSEWRSPSMCSLVARCADGVLVTYRGSYESRGEQTPYTGLWRFECERGDLLMDGEQKLWRIRSGQRELLHAAAADEVLRSDLGMLDSFEAALARGIEAPTSGRANLATLRLLFDVIRAGETSRA